MLQLMLVHQSPLHGVFAPGKVSVEVDQRKPYNRLEE